MKKLKLKLNKKGKTKVKEQRENVNTIQQLIFEDVRNINKFNIIIEEFILSMQSSDEKNLNKLLTIIFEIYDYFLVKNIEKISSDLKIFLNEKLNIILSVILEVINPDEEIEEDLMKSLFKSVIKFLNYTNEERVKSFFENITDSFVLNNDLVETSLITLITNSLGGAKEKKFLKIMLEVMYQKLVQSSTLSEYTLYNIFNFIISLPNKLQTDLKLTYQNILIILINNSSLPKEILKNILINLNKVIFDNLENSLILSDYLINIYERSTNEEFDIKVLSLSGLFVLLTKYRLDYNNYYHMLYKTISLKYFDSDKVKSVFDSSYRNRLFKILELSLTSSTVSIIVVLSFIKKMARVCLVTSANNIAIMLGIIQNIIKKHPRAVILLKRIKKNKTTILKDEKIIMNSKFNWEGFTKIEEKQDNLDELTNLRTDASDEDFTFFSKFEQFDDEELDPYNTNANMSCLWELYTLKSHFSFKIRALVNKFEKNFMRAKEFDVNSISNLKEEDLLYEINENAHFYCTPTISEEDFKSINERINIFI